MSNLRERLTSIFSVIGRGIGLLVLVLIAFVAGYVIHWGFAPAPTASTGVAVGGTPKAVTVWTCSMHPQVQQPEPGLCPFCGMKLIPRAKEQGMGGLRIFKTTEVARKLMEIETAPVERKFVTATLRMVGKVHYDETRLAYITAWIPGRLDRLYVDYTGVPVKKGEHLAYIYSPELLIAQEELIQALKAVKNLRRGTLDIIRESSIATVTAVKEKLRLWGLTPEQIAEIEKRGKPTDHLTIYAPVGGIVIHKNAVEGMYVQTGTRIYTIADLTQVWVKLDAYESDLMWLRYGQTVEFTSVSYPGEVFTGTIAFIDPILDEKTRTVKVRVNVSNKAGKLKPGMFVRAIARPKVAANGRVMEAGLASKWICSMHPEIVKDVAGKCDICEMPLVRTESLGYVGIDPAKTDKPLVIPSSSALFTGTRAIVYVRVPDKDKPTYEGREVVLGPRVGDYYLVRSGLEENDQVVVKGGFVIDSSLQIQAKPSMMTPEGGGGGGGHAGMDMSPKKPGEKKMKMKPGIELSPEVRAQFLAILSAAEGVKKAAKGGDLDIIKLAFSQLEKAVAAVDMKALTGHPHMLWMEHSMFLRNAAVEGKDIKTLKAARAVAAQLAKDVTRFAGAFMLNAADARPPAKKISSAARKALSEVLSGYVAMQQALSTDRKDGAVKAAKKMREAPQAMSKELLSPEDREGWTKHDAQFKKILGQAEGAKDIEGVRTAFALLSEELYAVAKQFGSLSGKPLYALRCPMAFSGRGALWLQNDKDVRNPYFGAAMPRCGEVEDLIPAAMAGGHEHE